MANVLDSGAGLQRVQMKRAARLVPYRAHQAHSRSRSLAVVRRPQQVDTTAQMHRHKLILWPRAVAQRAIVAIPPEHARPAKTDGVPRFCGASDWHRDV